MSTPAVDLRPYQRKLTRAEYHRMGEAGFFQDERVELLYGVVVEMSPKGGRHEYAVWRLLDRLAPALQGRARLGVSAPVVGVGESEPEPDLSVVPPGDYLDDPPREAWLIIEVADTSLAKDLGPKAALYASSGFPAYWVLDLQAGEAVVHRGPRPDGTWRSVTRHGRGEVLTAPPFDVEVPLDSVLPPDASPLDPEP